jgi:hypothetical protein
LVVHSDRHLCAPSKGAKKYMALPAQTSTDSYG